MPEPTYFYQNSEIKVKPFNEYGHDELKVNKQNSFKASSFAMNVKPKLMSQNFLKFLFEYFAQVL